MAGTEAGRLTERRLKLPAGSALLAVGMVALLLWRGVPTGGAARQPCTLLASETTATNTTHATSSSNSDDDDGGGRGSDGSGSSSSRSDDGDDGGRRRSSGGGSGGGSGEGSIGGGGGGGGGKSGGAWLEASDEPGPAGQPGPEPVPAGDDSADVALCLSSKDDWCDLREWVLHHAAIGVKKMYVFDTGSAPPLLGVLEDFVASGLVEYHYLSADPAALASRSGTVTIHANSSAGPLQLELEPPKKEKFARNWQLPVSSACLRHFGARHRWMGFIDSDEFVLLQPGVLSLPALLDRYIAHGGVILHWRLFSSGPHVVRPSGGVLASYTACCPANHPQHRWGKTFLQPAHAVAPLTPHRFSYSRGRHAVDLLGRRQDKGHTEEKGPAWEGAVLAHYITRSLWDYARKTARGGSDGLRGVRTLQQGLKWAATCRARCDAAVQPGRSLDARWDLGRGAPAFCRPAMAQAQDVLTHGGGDELRRWLDLLGEAAAASDGGAARPSDQTYVL